MKKLSLIIATYNRAQSLLRTLRSVVSQSAAPELWECIVVNNNSTDNTAEVFARFAAENQGFDLRMVPEVKQGLSNARNCGITASVGEYVAIVDDDETLESSYIESYIEFFDSFPTAMAAGGAVRAEYESHRPRWMSHYTERMIANPIDLDVVVTLFPSSRVPAGGNMAFRREIFDRVGLFNPRLGRNGQSLIGGEENDLFARLRAAGELLYFVPNAAIYHHIPDAKLTDEYFDRLSYNVGRSKALRAQSDEELSELMASERRKRVVTYILAALYTIALQPIKGQYLIRMRKGIYKGIKQL
jgi:glycosyltransferase involved in cell wall biosynthesis